jgi:hypothetical protein
MFLSQDSRPTPQSTRPLVPSSMDTRVHASMLYDDGNEPFAPVFETKKSPAGRDAQTGSNRSNDAPSKNRSFPLVAKLCARFLRCRLLHSKQLHTFVPKCLQWHFAKPSSLPLAAGHSDSRHHYLKGRTFVALMY